MGTELAYRSLANMDHAPRKSWVRQMFDKLTGVQRSGTMVRAHAKEAALTVRQFGEGMVTGAVLGAMNAELKGGLDFHGVPIDAAVGVVGAVGAFTMAEEEYAPDLRNVGTAGATIFAYRKTDAFLSEKKAARIAGETSGMHGEGETDVGAEDAIVNLARQL